MRPIYSMYNKNESLESAQISMCNRSEFRVQEFFICTADRFVSIRVIRG